MTLIKENGIYRRKIKEGFRTMDNPIIIIRGLQKIYKGGIKAVDDLSLEIFKNEIFGLIGPNGAGKTTTMKIILGLLFPDSGYIKIDGKAPRNIDIQRKIGYLPENIDYPEFMTGRQFLQFHGSLLGIGRKKLASRIDDVLHIVGMSERANDKIRKYSRGMKQRLFLAQALLNEPEIIFLDEPTTGLDPLGIIEFRNMILDFKSKGKTILLNSHQLSELEKICDRIAFINRGRLHKIIEASTYKEGVNEVEIEIGESNEQFLLDLGKKYTFSQKGNLLIFSLSEKDLNELLEFLIKLKAQILSVNRKRRTLEGLFIQFMEETK